MFSHLDELRDEIAQVSALNYVNVKSTNENACHAFCSAANQNYGQILAVNTRLESFCIMPYFSTLFPSHTPLCRYFSRTRSSALTAR